MKLTKLTALVAGMGFMVAAGSASATSLGEVWVGDQQDGKVYIFSQADLNDASVDAQEVVVDLTNGGTTTPRMHLIGFSNHNGLDPASRAQLAFLTGVVDIWKTNGGTLAPTFEVRLDVSNTATGAAKSSLHMCGNDPTNALMGCSSIGNKEVVMFTIDNMGNYTRIGGFPLSGLSIDSSIGNGKAKSAINKAIRKGILGGAPICNNFSTDSQLMYVTTNNGGVGGVLVLDVSNPANPTIRDAFNGTGVGCGLVNSQDGGFMWTNAGSKSDEDKETVMKWQYSDAYDDKKSGPRVNTKLPQTGQGDVHGAQFAGLGGLFLWELMRLDDMIHVIDPASGAVVNSFSNEFGANVNPGGDVLDRSALGTRMYSSLRGAIPTTAITGINDPDRRPGVMVMSTLFGYNGTITKIEDIQSGNTVFICPDGDEGDPDHDHGGYEICENDTHDHWDDREEVDTADPHGLKSLSYLSGGF